MKTANKLWPSLVGLTLILFTGCGTNVSGTYRGTRVSDLSSQQGTQGGTAQTSVSQVTVTLNQSGNNVSGTWKSESPDLYGRTYEGTIDGVMESNVLTVINMTSRQSQTQQAQSGSYGWNYYPYGYGGVGTGSSNFNGNLTYDKGRISGSLTCSSGYSCQYEGQNASFQLLEVNN